MTMEEYLKLQKEKKATSSLLLRAAKYDQRHIFGPTIFIFSLALFRLLGLQEKAKGIQFSLEEEEEEEVKAYPITDLLFNSLLLIRSEK